MPPFGPSAATIIVTLDAIILSSWASSRRHLGSSGFQHLRGSDGDWSRLTSALSFPKRPHRLQLRGNHFSRSLSLSATYFAVNSFFIAIAISYEKSSSPIEIWKETLHGSD